MSLAEEVREKALQLRQDFDDVKAAGYNEGYEAGVSAGGDVTDAYNEGFEAGKKAEYDLLWDTIQDNGNRTNYNFAFSAEMWSQDTFKPKYTIQPITAQNMCAYWGATLTITNPIDLRKVDLDFSKTTAAPNCFYRSRQITAVGVIDLSACLDARAFFQDAYEIETVEKFIVKDDGTTNITNAFTNMRALKNIEFEGILNSATIHFSASVNLTHDSLINLLNHLKDNSADTSGATYTLVLGVTNLAKLTDEEKAIATEKGWTLV